MAEASRRQVEREAAASMSSSIDELLPVATVAAVSSTESPSDAPAAAAVSVSVAGSVPTMPVPGPMMPPTMLPPHMLPGILYSSRYLEL